MKKPLASPIILLLLATLFTSTAALTSLATAGRACLGAAAAQLPPPTPRARPVRLNVKQASQIEVGAPLPLLDASMGIEVVTDECAFDDTCKVVESELSVGTTVLVGMPGAFTPTCTDEHLPGFIRSAKQLRRAGVQNLCVVTTNDKVRAASKGSRRNCCC